MILCDLDGTLIDTDHANHLSYCRAVTEVTKGRHRLRFRSEHRLNRKRLKELLPHLSDAEYQKIIALKEQHFRSFLPETKLNPALAGLIEKFSKTNLTVLVTDAREQRALMTLEHHGVLGHFAHIFCADANFEKISSNKYAQAVARLKINPAEALVFENEVACARKAIEAGVLKDRVVLLDVQPGKEIS